MNWKTMDLAPLDGTIIALLCTEENNHYPLEDEGNYVTIGYNNFHNNGDDQWHRVGWDWCHDIFVHVDRGMPMAWALLPGRPT